MKEQNSDSLVNILMGHIEYLEKRLVQSEEILERFTVKNEEEGERLYTKYRGRFGGHFKYVYLGES